MDKKIFFLHPHKCGGLSVAKALQQSSIKSQCMLDLGDDIPLSESDASIFYGHTHELCKSKGLKNEAFKLQAFIYLYFQCSLIMPVRHPANIVQSWMHYNCVRFNEALKRNTLTDLTFQIFKSLISLKQSSIALHDDKLHINGNKIVLKEEDEEENLKRFASNLLSVNIDRLLFLRSMERTLFYPYFAINSKSLEGSSVEINPPTPAMRDIHYFDIENITDRSYSFFEERIGKDFAKAFKATRENVSTPKSRTRGKCMPRFVEFLKKYSPNEFKIFNMAYS